MTNRDEYVLGYRQAEQERLRRQARELAHESEWLFDQIGVAAGAHVVEIGCGPCGCLDLLAKRVGPSGRVVGVERSPDAAALARKMIEDGGLSNVDVVCRDARATELPRGAFDLATSRLVLVNIPDPQQIVAEAVALVRPGGWVAWHEADWVAHVCDPPSDAWTRLVNLFLAYAKTNGIDSFIGRKVPRMLRSAGLLDIRANPIVHVYGPGNPRRRILLDFAENLRERILQQALASERELTDLMAALERHLDDPGTLVLSHLFLQVWGRKPS